MSGSDAPEEGYPEVRFVTYGTMPGAVRCFVHFVRDPLEIAISASAVACANMLW